MFTGVPQKRYPKKFGKPRIRKNSKKYVMVYDFRDILSGVRQFVATEKPLNLSWWRPLSYMITASIMKGLKMMKNAFYFTIKALFILNIFQFLSWPFGHVEKLLIRKIRLISILMTSQHGKQTIAIHILPNSSRKKGNHTMKFSQLIEYNCGRETIPWRFS